MAYRLAANTVLGFSKNGTETMSIQVNLKMMSVHLREVTIEAIRVLEENNFRSAVIECERACFGKIK